MTNPDTKTNFDIHVVQAEIAAFFIDHRKKVLGNHLVSFEVNGFTYMVEDSLGRILIDAFLPGTDIRRGFGDASLTVSYLGEARFVSLTFPSLHLEGEQRRDFGMAVVVLNELADLIETVSGQGIAR